LRGGGGRKRGQSRQDEQLETHTWRMDPTVVRDRRVASD
jgi:hypothetical protein